MDNNQIFLLADKLAALYEEKDVTEAIIKDIAKDIKSLEYQLSADMSESGLQSFTRADTVFYLSGAEQGAVSVKSAPVR